MPSNRKSEIHDILGNLSSQGFTYSKTKNGHWKVVGPDGRTCQIAATPHNTRSVLNAVTRLKRIGYIHPKARPAKKSQKDA